MDGVIIMSYSLGNITLDPNTITLSTSGDYYNNAIWTTASDVWSATGTNGLGINGINNNDLSGRITLKGEQADVDINGRSLKDFMDRVEQRLAILQPNPELEKEWEELKALGDQYRQLEQDIKDKMKTWDILNKP